MAKTDSPFNKPSVPIVFIPTPERFIESKKVKYEETIVELINYILSELDKNCLDVNKYINVALGKLYPKFVLEEVIHRFKEAGWEISGIKDLNNTSGLLSIRAKQDYTSDIK